MITDDEKLVQEALEGGLDADGFAGLQERMRDEPELVALYREHALLGHGLHELVNEPALIDLPEAEPEPIAPITFRKPPKPSRFPAFALAAAAALVAAGAVWLWFASQIETNATIAWSADAVWETTGGSKGSLAQGETFKLVSGRAQLTLPSGATAVVTSPSQIEFAAADHLRLLAGSALFEKRGGGLVVETRGFTATDLGTTFGVLVNADGSGQLHVFEGSVELKSPKASLTLAGSEAAGVAGGGAVEPRAADPALFPSALPESHALFEENFAAGLPGGWQLADGDPKLVDGSFEGSGFQAFRELPTSPDASRPVLLVTFEVAQPEGGAFHSSRWAGLSLYSGNEELAFFGDAEGDPASWALDVRQGQVPKRPRQALAGARTVTLRYDWNTGAASLHEGYRRLAPAFVGGQLPARLDIDRLRIAASGESSIAPRMVAVRLLESAN